MNRAGAVPVLNESLTVVDDVHAAQCADKQTVFWCNGKACHHLMLQRMACVVSVKLASVTAEQSSVGGKPYLIVIPYYTGSIIVAHRCEHVCEVLGYELSILLHVFAHASVNAHHHGAALIYVTHSEFGHTVGVRG